MMQHSDGCGNGVGRSRICLTSFNGPTPKKPLLGARISDICYTSSVIAHCLRFCCHGNRGHPGVNLNDAIKLAVPIKYKPHHRTKHEVDRMTRLWRYCHSNFSKWEVGRRSLVAGRWSSVGRSSIYLQWKNFENLLKFEKGIAKSLVASFWDTVYMCTA